MDAKSVVTSPSPQAPITHGKGPLVITGLAWSGRGAITRVDVTLDGGKSWREARLVPNANPLSLHRAESTRNYLTSKGVNGSRIHVEGRGSMQPVATNDTAEGRGRNRRVEIFVGERTAQ